MVYQRAIEDIVTEVYRGLLRRDPDPLGLEHYRELLQNGTPLDEVLRLIVAGVEFQKVQGHEHDITLDNARHWIGFGAEEIAYIQSWYDPDIRGKDGFLTDFVGVRTRISSLWKECAGLDGIVYPLPVPNDYHADIIEYVGTLRAVDAAGSSLSVMELGAGTGPWITTAAVAARRKGIQDIYLCAVEGDPERHRLMLQHLKDNELQSYPQDILQAAVGVTEGEAFWPRLSAPTEQSGARPLRASEPEDIAYLQSHFSLSDMIRVRVVAFEDLLAKRPVWDLIHIDVQGTEADLCRSAISTLNARARYLVIGTHSRKLDGELIEIFHAAGWRLEHEKPAIIHYDPGVAHVQMTIVDGTQVWRNQNL